MLRITNRLAPQMGMSQQAFSRRVTGAIEFSLGEIASIARLLGTTEGYLLGFEMKRAPVVSTRP